MLLVRGAPARAGKVDSDNPHRARVPGMVEASVAATRAANDNVTALDVLAAELRDSVARFKLS
ncbi:hypothetical protein FXN63_24280 [Pigmentiphaga aceris]|uniref:Uncharacterized protein n=1 Tax=Pigmentiphaga aceris TaxID=1940612 RepID=A0A5C0B6N5_9BURK|nr:hypothetical protein [Pigmentiphaga aceris]QEI08611.1 hypothetical protein FXN63_24280 [Pigmentiphaga aceris]